MNTRSRALRLVLAASLTLGMTAVGLGLAESASANTGFPSSSPVTPIAGHEVDTGVIVLQFDASQAGLTAAVATPDPADSTAVSTVTGVIGADGSVNIRDFAGPAAVYIKTADGQVHQLGSSPLPGTVMSRQAASIFRGQTWTYSYAADNDTFTPINFPSGPVTPPTAAEVLTQIPITHFTVDSSDANPGWPLDLRFSSISPNGIGDPNYTNSVTSYIYGQPDSLGATIVRNGRFDVAIPARYSYGEHTVGSFDKYGRLVTVAKVGSASAPSAPAGSSAAAHPLDTGNVLLELQNVMSGTIVTSTVADPTNPGASSVVSATVTSNGLVALTNFAGYARIDIGSGSADDNQNPATFRADVNIYRAQTVVYGYPVVSTTDNNPFGLIGPVPAPVIPTTAAEAEALTPVATSMVSPTSWPAGSDLTLDFTNVTPTSIVPNDSLTVDNYVYGAPTALGSSTIPLMSGGFAYSFVVPGSFTSGGTVAASFDQFGRLVTLDRLDGAVATAGSDPVSTPAPTTSAPAAPSSAGAATATPSALANTGQTDVAPAGIAAFVLFGVGAIVLIVSRGRRRASCN
ncbi:hypothetical protein [Subtercola endophyticus]|uniref:hypothetical protein n=1 Tax=Subtercola endophyticus TaxID=2895559 RepID=UPI001E456C70|nr:hypothetical protein [Subtercola endophyticus]UFS59094.1 hypothetical protein LQ955_19300 [Subtercola endophyticus]